MMPDNPTLRANLLALAATSPQVARAVLQAGPRPDVQFIPTDDGVPSAILGAGPGARQLASRRCPLDEARALAATIDLAHASGVLVPGFGVGHHAGALVDRLPPPAADGNRLPPWGVIVIFEPDVPLLRAVLEHVDHSAWIRRGDVVFVTEATRAAIAAAMQGREALPFLGTDVAFLDHPAQRARLGASVGEFETGFREWMGLAHALTLTTLTNVGTTVRNVLGNLRHYVNASGVADLAGAGAGKPAIVVAAGPSLRRNIGLLKGRGVRDRFVIIACQTVLKTLLAEGIRPHLVTALDYHEISRRFYEGLSAEDAEDVTLVAEARANPAILDFRGVHRLPADPLLEALLGDDLSRLMGSFKQRANVAHMAYTLARYLGCEPVILVGQDLGFTDGQYYAAGAAIHQVWGGELSEFRTLEMLEWERIVRANHPLGGGIGPDGAEIPGRPNLRKLTDVLGRPIYTDDQMASYLAQFEQDFREHEARGLTTIDATEGGVAKAHTVAMTLKEAMERCRGSGEVRLPPARPAPGGDARLRRTRERVRQVRQDVWRIAEHSRRAAKLIDEMLSCQHDQARLNRLIGQAHAIGEEVSRLRPAFDLVQYLNQAGSLKRVRADREIALARDLAPMQVQRKELERDRMNVRWLADVADELGDYLDATSRLLDTGEWSVGGPGGRGGGDGRAQGGPASIADQAAAAPGRAERARIVAMIPVDAAAGGLGMPRDLGAELAPGRTILRCVLERLAQCRELDGVVLLAAPQAPLDRLIGTPPPGLAVEVVRTPDPLAGRTPALRGARLWSSAAWRGGLAGLTVYDEACAPGALAPVMEARGIDGAAIVGADWAFIDPVLVDAAISRFREGEGRVRLTFCQAPPGLGACVVERSLMRELASNAQSAGTLATLGARLGYSPLFPMADPIANLHADPNGRPVCVTCAPALRDCGLRLIADSGHARDLMACAVRALGDGWARATPEALLGAAFQVEPRGGDDFRAPKAAILPPREFVVELCTGRHTSGRRGAWLRGGRDCVERPVMSMGAAEHVLKAIAAMRPDAAVTFYGAGDPLLHPDLPRIIAAARRAGVGGVHVRTDLVCGEPQLGALLECAPDVISVDLMAESAATYRALMGADLFERARGNLGRLLERRAASAGGLPIPWIVPRITRCDGTYGEIEAFYDRWLLAAGAAVIDPMPGAVPGERIGPLPPPPAVALRLARDRMIVRSDGSVLAGTPDSRAFGDAARDDLPGLWKKALAHAAGARAAEAEVITGESGGPAREREAELLAGPA